MAKWGNTTFTEFCGEGGGPNELFSQETGRMIRYLDITPATVEARQAAIADFLGYHKVITVAQQSGPNNLRYVARSNPLPYVWQQTAPSNLPIAQSYYATSILRGQAIGPTGKYITPAVGLSGILVGGNFARYRFTVEFTEPSYDIKADGAVLAQAGDSGGDIGTYPVSPLYDTSGADAVGYPDEGQQMSGLQFYTVPLWPDDGTWPIGKPAWSTASRYITRENKTSVRTTVVPYGLLRWSDGKSIREGFPYTEAMGGFKYQWFFVPEAAVPIFAISQQLGTVNEWWFDGYAPYTLLFKSWDFRRFKGPLGDVLYHVEYSFTWLPHQAKGAINPDTASPFYTAGRNLGWNYQLRCRPSSKVVVLPDGTSTTKNWIEYDQVVDNPGPTAVNVYPATPFDNLFRPDQP